MVKKVSVLIVLFFVFICCLSSDASAKKGGKFQHADRNNDGAIDKKEWRMEKQWEYKNVVLPTDARLETLGRAGWELVAVIKSITTGDVFYFKRELEL